MGALAEAKHEWRHFRTDAPGQRFMNHRLRMRGRPRHHAYIASGVGVVFVAAGTVMLFMPGPGTLVIALGVALFASHSIKLATGLDRAEPRVRQLLDRTKGKWRDMRGSAKFGVILGIATFALAAMFVMYRIVSPLLLG